MPDPVRPGNKAPKGLEATTLQAAPRFVSLRCHQWGSRRGDGNGWLGLIPFAGLHRTGLAHGRPTAPGPEPARRLGQHPRILEEGTARLMRS